MSKHTKHQSPAEHYRKAEELIQAAEEHRALIKTGELDDREYQDVLDAMQTYLLTAAVHAALATATNTTAALAGKMADDAARAPETPPDARTTAQRTRRAPDPHDVATDRYIARLEAKVEADGGYGSAVADAMRLLKSDDPTERGQGRTAAATILGDLR